MSDGSTAQTAAAAVEGLLQRSRTELGRGRARESLVSVQRAWELACEAGLPPALRVAVGTQLVGSARAAGLQGHLRVLHPDLYAIGVRDPEFVREFAEHLLEAERGEPDDLEILITALEQAEDEAWRERVLHALIDGLDVDLSAHPATAQALLPLLERTRRACPDASFPRYQLGRLAFLMGDLEQAFEHLAAVQGSLSSSPRLLNLRAHVAERSGRFAEALESYRHSLAADPHQPHVHFGIGRILLHRFAAAACQ